MKKFINLMLVFVLPFFTLQLMACNKENVVPGDTALTPFEKQSLAFMREEEKMAFDVYTVMDARWGLLPFANIKGSEASHMAAVKTLLDRYALPDPAAGKGQGEYASSLISQLYAMLKAKGDSSEILSLTAGAIIEEVDIRDLKEQLLQIEKTDIRQVYDNLMRGSRNHLRAFVSNLASRGIVYRPQYLSPEEFDAIISSGMERGSGNGYRRNN
jgi:hypothetical protein